MIPLLIALVCQAPKPSALGDAAPAAVKLRPGDVVRIDTGIPGTGVPGIELWHRPKDPDKDPAFTELECWAFCSGVGSKEPLEQVHFMADRFALRYLPTKTKVLVVAVHGDWWTASAPMKGVPLVEVIPYWKGDVGRGPVRKSGEGIVAVPLPYLTPPDHRDPRMEILPILKRATDPHRHRYCTDDRNRHTGEHICAMRFDDALAEWKERQKQTAEVERKGRDEARRRNGSGHD